MYCYIEGSIFIFRFVFGYIFEMLIICDELYYDDIEGV